MRIALEPNPTARSVLAFRTRLCARAGHRQAALGVFQHGLGLLADDTGKRGQEFVHRGAILDVLKSADQHPSGFEHPGAAVVRLRPVPASGPPSPNGCLSPREALRRLQTEARLTPDQAQQYLNELHDERLAAEARRPA